MIAPRCPDPRQPDLFAVHEPPPPPPPAYVPRARREVMTRAYGTDTPVTVYADGPDPLEVVVRGTPCLIAGLGSSATYTVEGPGSLFWSETGFRSFGALVDPDAAVAAIERYIDAPAKDGNGCGGKLVRWWPGYVLDWRNARSWAMGVDRSTAWDQWGPEAQAEHWARHDARLAAAEDRMRAEGIDPAEVGPPPGHRGKWG